MSYTAKDFYNDEIARLNAKNANADAILNTNQRLASLNDSYRKRYSRYVQILMVLVLAYIIYLVAILLQKQFGFPQFVIDVLIVVLIFAVAFYIFSIVWELNSRSVLNYDEIEMPAYDSSGGVDSSILSGKESGSGWGMCINNECCPTDYTYNSGKNKCVLDTATPTTTSSATPSRATFTTLEYVKVESAHNSDILRSDLKREPNANAMPSENVSKLGYSKA